MNKLTKTQQNSLEKLALMPDSKIDFSDVPEVKNWGNAVVGKFYKPIKQPVTIRLDSDVVAWFKSKNGKYQSNINQALREYMKAHANSVKLG